MSVRGNSVPSRKAGNTVQWCQATESCADSSKWSILAAAGEVAWNAAVSSPPERLGFREHCIGSIQRTIVRKWG